MLSFTYVYDPVINYFSAKLRRNLLACKPYDLPSLTPISKETMDLNYLSFAHNAAGVFIGSWVWGYCRTNISFFFEGRCVEIFLHVLL